MDPDWTINSHPRQFQRRTPWQIQRAVIFALFLREMKTRFGSKRLGYFWAILEPAAIIIVFWAMFGLAMRGGSALPGVDYPMFLLTGMLPFNLFSGIVNKSMAAFEANQGLFNYRQVKPFDALLARCLVECVVYLIVFLILVLAGMALGFDAAVHDFLGLSLTLLLLVGFAFGFGLLCAMIGLFSENFKKFIGIMMRPLFFTSGIFFAVSMMPEKFRWILLLNPLLNFLELIRVHYFEAFQSPEASYLYIVFWTMGSLSIGLWLYTHLKHRIVMSS
jgi:capsular polysaccharide transport system permease protein